MEKEKLIIKNFGPIKEVELDLGRVTVLIGEQATGKSTIAKVLAVCRYFSNLVSIHLDNLEIGSTPFALGLNEQGLFHGYINKNTYIEYECFHYILVAQSYTQKLINSNVGVTDVLHISQELKTKSSDFRNILIEFENIKKTKTELNQVEWNARIEKFISTNVANVLDNPFYLPTERGLQSIFSIGKRSIGNISDSLFEQLADIDGIARYFNTETQIETLGIYYKNINGHGFIRKEGKQDYYSMSNAASGYKSMIPIVLSVKYYWDVNKKTKTLIIEEPELDVFPTAQHKLIQYLVEMSKVHNSMLLMTTHSPYTLTSLNNLMYAYQVGQTHPEKVNKITDKKYWINPADVSAYMMKADGTCENIIDTEEGMIIAEKIDVVSKIINREFDELMNIELEIDAENN